MMLQPHEARANLPRALQHLEQYPDDRDALAGAGHCYNVLEDDRTALKYYERCLPTDDPMLIGAYGFMLRVCSRFEEAFPYVERAHQMLPDDMRMGLAYAEELIRRGEFLKAWPLFSRYRWSKARIVEADIPEWHGEDLKGKWVVVFAEGGRGDSFWLFRFMPRLRELGASVSFLAPPDIGEFFKDHPYLQGEERNPATDRPDYWVSIFELLQWLDVEKPWWGGPYMAAEPDAPPLTGKLGRRNNLPDYMFAPDDVPLPAPVKNVGLCWEGGEIASVRKYKALKIDQAARLLRHRNVSWTSLQKDIKAPVECLEPDLSTWKKTARIIAGLDLVVTVDTSITHLAGALGKPVWLILGGFASHIFGMDSATGWYPGMRIFRNMDFGFDNVVAQVEAALEAL